MSTARQSDPLQIAARLLSHLRELRNDRGAMAELRCALSPTKRHRAWPLLARVGGIDNLRIEIVAGLFAYHPDEIRTGNLGTTCLAVFGASDTKSKSGSRIRRLLACDRDELCERVRPIIFAAKSKGVAVNYEALLRDLYYWGEKVKADWAREYWGAPEADAQTVLAAPEIVP